MRIDCPLSTNFNASQASRPPATSGVPFAAMKTDLPQPVLLAALESPPKSFFSGSSSKLASKRFAWASFSAIILFSVLESAFAQDEKRSELSAWEHSVVTIEVARKQYDYFLPWSKRTIKLRKIGLAVGDRQILTTAGEMFDRTLVRVQKGGRGQWWIGEVTWIDYHADLALVTVSDAEFWRDLRPVVFDTATPSDGALQILRWRDGNLESRRAEFTRYTVREGQLSAVNHAVLEAGSEIQGTGWGEPLIANSHVVGIIRAQEGRICVATPASFIRAVLEAHKKGAYHGLGYFHFYWQPAENPDSLAWLKLPGEPHGVIVTQISNRPDGGAQVLKPLDILLKIDSFDLDIQGDYNDPEYGHLMLENLATRGKWAGDEVKMQIWRDGKAREVVYRLPKFEYSNALVPYAVFDQEPEYFIAGGLVFQPLTDSYLRSWGPEWKQRSPFRLNYYNNEEPTKERPALVILSQVLPDAYNIGYQDQRYLVVNKVNGQRVNRLPELRAALAKPINGFHILEFTEGESLRRMVLNAGGPEQEATARVLKRYGIADADYIASDKTN